MSAPLTNPPSTLERDPVCGMNVNPATAKNSQKLDGKYYYFCCAGCAHKFKADPQRYLAKKPSSSGLVMLGSAPAAAGAPHPKAEIPQTQTERDAAYVCPMCPEVRASKAGACPSCGMALEADVPVRSTRTEYTCPMHPEVVRSGPGSCPICGMALEPRTVPASPEENPELRDMTRRFWVSLAFTAPQ